jgi:hypothetical protein
MAHGVSKGQIDPKFQARIDELEQKAKKALRISATTATIANGTCLKK